MNDDEVESETLIYPSSSVCVMRKSSPTSFPMFKYLSFILISTVMIFVYLECSMEEETVTTVPLPSEHLSVTQSVTQENFTSPESNSHQVFDEMHKIWSRFKPLCHAPVNVNAKDPLAMLWNKNDTFSCPHEEPLTQLDESNGRLTMSAKFVNDSNISCFYSHMSRSQYDENIIEYGEQLPLTGDIYLTNDLSTVNVSCHKNVSVIYQNTHMYIDTYHFERNKKCNGDWCNYRDQLFHDEENGPIIQSSSKKSIKPSVVIIFLESLSQLNFERSMIETKVALESLGNVTTFKYFVKPLDNSFPNTMAMLTGERIQWPRETTLKNDYFDEKFKYLWDYYHASGYVTGFMEDLTRISVFKYGKWGFYNQPVDFYPRPFWLQMYANASDFDINGSMSQKKQFCFRKNGKKVTLFLNQINQFIKKQTEPSFLFAFYSQMTHTDIHSYEWVDSDFAKFFTSIKEHLNNTILVFAGDHGFRMSSYTPTSLGRLEERMNLVTVRIPDALDEQYPHLRKFLNSNSDRLVSWLDINLMLRQFATGEYKLFPSLDSYGSLDVPINPARQFVHPLRSCPHAAILPEFCVCNQFVSVAVDGTFATWDVQPASKSLVTAVNAILGRTNDNCDLQTYNSTGVFKYYIQPESPSQTQAKVYLEVLLSPSNVSVASFVTRRQDVDDSWSLDQEMNSKFNIKLERAVNNTAAFGCGSS